MYIYLKEKYVRSMFNNAEQMRNINKHPNVLNKQKRRNGQIH